MKDHDKTRSKIQGLILFEKHAGNNAVDSVEKAVEQRPVVKEEAAEVFVNGKNTMPVDNVYQLEGHGGGTPHGIKIPAGRAEAAVATKRDKLRVSEILCLWKSMLPWIRVRYVEICCRF